MNKQQLIEEINNIPKFVLRDVAVVGNYKEVGEVDDWIETENWKAVTEESNSGESYKERVCKILFFSFR